MNCILCKGGFSKDQILFEDTHSYIIYPLRPKTYGHFMVIPKRHLPIYNELSDVEVISFKNLITHVFSILKNKENAIGYNILSNNGGPKVGQSVNHLHFHVFIRFPNDVNPFKILSKEIPAESLSEEEWMLKSDLFRQMFHSD